MEKKEELNLIKELNLTGNLTLEDIEKIRAYDNKKTKGMSVKELNKYYEGAEKRFYERAEKAEKTLEKRN